MKNKDINYAQCRVLGHAWDEVPGDVWEHGKRRLLGIRLLFRCVRCGCLRDEVWARTGRLLTRYYRYPTDYQIPNAAKPSGGREVFRQVFLVERKGHQPMIILESEVGRG